MCLEKHGNVFSGEKLGSRWGNTHPWREKLQTRTKHERMQRNESETKDLNETKEEQENKEKRARKRRRGEREKQALEAGDGDRAARR